MNEEKKKKWIKETEKLEKEIFVLPDGEEKKKKTKELNLLLIKDIEEQEKSDPFYKAINVFINKLDLAKQFTKIQPLYYDSSKIWWMWNNKKFMWEIKDEIDLLNEISRHSSANTIKAKEKMEILEALRQIGRKNKPQEIKKTWIQFKDKIIDIMTEEIIKSSSKYFVTNPIPWEIGESVDTPTMDKIFEEWVGEENVPLLYEIIAYCMLSDYPIHRLFCFIGAGLNGKSKFQELICKFIDKSNTTSTELDALLSSRFENAKLYKKSVCFMGETNFNQLSRTSRLKRLTGQDLMNFEFKNKNPFDDYNYAKIVIATNTLPITTDKTIGFYRRWLIVDFPNKFNETKNILDDIPEVEYNNLAKKSIDILKKLLKKREFTNEGTIEERTRRFEEKSNPLSKFLKENIIKDPKGHVFKFEFIESFKSWLEENKYRVWNDIEIGKMMKILYETKQVKYDEGHKYRAWIGLSWKEHDKQDKHLNPTQIPTCSSEWEHRDNPVKGVPKDELNELSEEVEVEKI